ncbi:MAG: Na/Pi cotransporter family protein [Elusimicrobiota bacterium]|nr:Na/Pi cotransporter family protein [Elusimicrobiota bacterium]
MLFKDIIFGIIGGLGLFIFGMKYLSEGLQKIASNKIKNIMAKVTNNNFIGVLLGTFVTTIIQSSSVTTVILIGFINSGILTFLQSASIVLGANIGTTITAQIIAFNISVYSLPMVGIGIFLMLFFKKEKIKIIGQIIFSTGMIFLGLEIMSQVLKPFRDIPQIMKFFVILSKSPLLCIFCGFFFTIIIQSSSASIGTLIALASSELIGFESALYILLGDNIGTTITAWIASIGGRTSAKRLATFHSFFNVIGAIYFTFLITSGFYSKFIDYMTPGDFSGKSIARYIANAHTFFNIINTMIFLPFINFFVRVIEKLIPEKENEYLSNSVKYLQDSLLETPEFAFENAKKEISEMAKMSNNILKLIFEGFLDKDVDKIKKVFIIEDEIDKLQHDITLYLSKIVNVSNEISSSLPVLIHSINDIERISDHAVNIAEISEKMLDLNITFSAEALDDLKQVFEVISKMSYLTDNVFEYYTTKDLHKLNEINEILDLEKKMNTYQKEFFDNIWVL